jgi:hypothetical protein
MKILLSIILALVAAFVVTFPVAAGDCDPGRANDGQNGYVNSTTVQATTYNNVAGEIEVSRPFLENGEWVNSYVELTNGGNYIRWGVSYRDGFATRRYVSSSWFSTVYYSVGSDTTPYLSINTYELGAARVWDVYQNAQLVDTFSQTTGRWTPTKASAWFYTSSGGNSVPGSVSNQAWIDLLSAQTTTGYLQSFGGVYKKINWPAGGTGVTGTIKSWETAC